MLPESPKHLEDIRDAAAFIIEISGELSLDSYLDNRLVRQAVKRQPTQHHQPHRRDASILHCAPINPDL